MKRITIILLAVILLACTEDADRSSSGESGVGGSTARFTIVDDFLYVVNSSELRTFDISEPEQPEQTSNVTLWQTIETIYGLDDYLFIGGQSGMQVFSIGPDGSPSYLSEYNHTTACDPVIANSQYAYVTIRSGEDCNNGFFDANQLITLDISNIYNPYEVSSFQMINPRGLAFFKGDLFVGEGDSGLKQFSLDNPAEPELIEYYEDIAANDMIALDDVLIITRDEGIYLFGYDEDDVLQLLSPLK